MAVLLRFTVEVENFVFVGVPVVKVFDLILFTVCQKSFNFFIRDGDFYFPQFVFSHFFFNALDEPDPDHVADKCNQALHPEREVGNCVNQHHIVECEVAAADDACKGLSALDGGEDADGGEDDVDD